MTTRLILLYTSATLMGVLALLSFMLASGSPVASAPGRQVEFVAFSARVNGQVIDYELAVESPAHPAEVKQEFLDGIGGTEVQPFVISNSTPKSPSTWHYNPAGRPLEAPLTDPAASLQAAAATWTGADSPFEFRYGGETSAAAGLCRGVPMDGINVVAWYPSPDPDTNVLGVTCSVTAVATREKLEYDIEFWTRPTWTDSLAAVSRDFESVALHEFGHAVGLGHSTNTQAAMYGAYFIGSVKRSLHPEDVAGLQFLHGSSSGAAEPPTSTPTATATNTPTATPTMTATPTPAAARKCRWYREGVCRRR